MHPMQRNIPINPEQVKQQINLLEAKLAMQQHKRNCLVNSGKATRKFVSAFVKSQTRSVDLELKWWTDARYEQEQIELQTVDVVIAELQSALAIHRAALEETVHRATE